MFRTQFLHNFQKVSKIKQTEMTKIRNLCELKNVVVTVLANTVELRPEAERMLGFNSALLRTALESLKLSKARERGRDGQGVEPLVLSESSSMG